MGVTPQRFQQRGGIVLETQRTQKAAAATASARYVRKHQTPKWSRPNRIRLVLVSLDRPSPSVICMEIERQGCNEWRPTELYLYNIGQQWRPRHNRNRPQRRLDGVNVLGWKMLTAFCNSQSVTILNVLYFEARGNHLL